MNNVTEVTPAVPNNLYAFNGLMGDDVIRRRYAYCSR